MIIWMFMAIGLVVIVAGGFVGRSRRARVTRARLGRHEPPHDPPRQGCPQLTRARAGATDSVGGRLRWAGG